MKGAISQEKQEKVFFWSGGREAVCFLILICRSPRKGTKKLKSRRTELEGRRVKVSFYIKNSQSRPLFKAWNFIILGPAGSLLEESSWLLGIQILEKCRFSHFHSCKSNNFLARNTNMGKAMYLELCPRVRSDRAQLLLQKPRGNIQDKAKQSLSVLVLNTGTQLHWLLFTEPPSKSRISQRLCCTVQVRIPKVNCSLPGEAGFCLLVSCRAFRSRT